MRHHSFAMVGVVGLGGMLACASFGRSSANSATAVVRDASGATLGELRFIGVSTGVHITGDLTGLSPGPHGLHLHQTGRCDAPAFAAAGAHLNPQGRMHGLNNPAGPHAGDLPGIIVPASGRVSVDVSTSRVSLGEPAASSLFDGDGTAIVVHASADDQRTDPSGGSGARIACGVVERG